MYSYLCKVGSKDYCTTSTLGDHSPKPRVLLHTAEIILYLVIRSIDASTAASRCLHCAYVATGRVHYPRTLHEYASVQHFSTHIPEKEAAHGVSEVNTQ